MRRGTSQIMPYYGQPIGLPGIEEVGFGFNKDVITGLLRERYGFDGIVCTDWMLINTRQVGGGVMEARAWGVEHLTPVERDRSSASRRASTSSAASVPGVDRRGRAVGDDQRGAHRHLGAPPAQGKVRAGPVR